jgi:hypothetical protein
VARKLLPLVRPRLLIVPGLLVGTAGMATLTWLGPDSHQIGASLGVALLNTIAASVTAAHLASGARGTPPQPQTTRT